MVGKGFIPQMWEKLECLLVAVSLWVEPGTQDSLVPSLSELGSFFAFILLGGILLGHCFSSCEELLLISSPASSVLLALSSH